MWTGLPYLIEVQVCFVLLWLFYHAGLRRSSRFGQNRAYLLLAVPVSFLIPALSIPVLNPAPAVAAHIVPVAGFAGTGEIATGVVVPGAVIGWKEIAVGIALFVSALLLIRSLCGAGKFGSIIRRASFISYRGAKVIFTDKGPSAFSFFNYVFINRKQVSSAGLPQVMEHELTHVNLRHGWDLLLCEAMRIVFWWNPVVRCWIRSLKEQHEYQADDAVLRRGFDAEAYIAFMLQEIPGVYPGFISGFSSSLIRNRLEMIGGGGLRNVRMRMALSLPLCAGLLALFALSERPVAVEIPFAGIVAGTDAGAKDDGFSAVSGTGFLEEEIVPAGNPAFAAEMSVLEGRQNDAVNHERRGGETAGQTEPLAEPVLIPVADTLQPAAETILAPLDRPVLARLGEGENETNINTVTGLVGHEVKAMLVAEVMPRFMGDGTRGGLVAFQSWMHTQLRYPEAAGAQKIEGKVVASFVVNTDGSITDIRILNQANELLSQETRRVMELSPKWAPARHEGKPVAIAMTLPVDFRYLEGLL